MAINKKAGNGLMNCRLPFFVNLCGKRKGRSHAPRIREHDCGLIRLDQHSGKLKRGFNYSAFLFL